MASRGTEPAAVVRRRPKSIARRERVALTPPPRGREPAATTIYSPGGGRAPRFAERNNDERATFIFSAAGERTYVYRERAR